MWIEEDIWNSELLPSAEEMEFLPDEDLMVEVLGHPLHGTHYEE